MTKRLVLDNMDDYIVVRFPPEWACAVDKNSGRLLTHSDALVDLSVTIEQEEQI